MDYPFEGLAMVYLGARLCVTPSSFGDERIGVCRWVVRLVGLYFGLYHGKPLQGLGTDLRSSRRIRSSILLVSAPTCIARSNSTLAINLGPRSFSSHLLT